MGTPFRDASLADLVVEKAAELEAVERTVSPLLRVLLPVALSSVIRRERPIAVAPADTPEELFAKNAALDLVIAAWREAKMRSVELCACGSDDVVSPVAPIGDRPWTIEERYDLAIRRGLDARMAELGGADGVQRFGDHGYVAELLVEDLRAVLTCDCAPWHGRGEWERAYTSRLTMAIASPHPRLYVTRRSPFAALKRVVGFLEEQRVGEADFDEVFVVEGSIGANVLLGRRVQQALLALLEEFPRLHGAKATFTIERALATVAWSYDTELPDGIRPHDLLSGLASNVLLEVRDVLRTG